MNSETIAAILDESRDEIRAAAVQALKARVAENFGYRMTDELNAQIKAFVTTEVAPEVAKMLADEKAGILAAIEPAIASIGAELAKKMLATAAEQLTGYNGREIVAKLMGGR